MSRILALCCLVQLTVYGARVAGEKRTIMTDTIMNMFKKQELLLKTIEKGMAVKFAEVNNKLDNEVKGLNDRMDKQDKIIASLRQNQESLIQNVANVIKHEVGNESLSLANIEDNLQRITTDLSNQHTNFSLITHDIKQGFTDMEHSCK